MTPLFPGGARVDCQRITSRVAYAHLLSFQGAAA
jgi:hypothetical protein